MASGRQDTLIRGPGAAAVVAAPKVSAAVEVPLPTIHTSTTVLAPRVAAAASVPSVGAGDPTPFGVVAVVGANSFYEAHPTIANMPVRESTDFLDDGLAAAIARPGRILAGPHGYSGASWPAAFSSTSVNWADNDGWGWAFLNVKTGTGANAFLALRDATNGFTDAFINAFIDSVPTSVKLVFTVNHEPENDGTQPNGDGGTWETTNAPIWCAGIARVANLVAARNRPNVFFAVVHMTVTFPEDGVVSGATGTNGRVTARWNCWAGMNAAAKARTIFAPDGYTKVETDTAVAQTGSTNTFLRTTSTEAGAFRAGNVVLYESNGGPLVEQTVFTITSITGSGATRDIHVTPSFASIPNVNRRIRLFTSVRERFGGTYDYVQNAGWGVEHFGVFEHAVNNDVGASAAHTATIYEQDIKPWLRELRDADQLACYVGFDHSDTGGASGTSAWVGDTPEERLAFGKIAWEFNTGEVL